MPAGAFHCTVVAVEFLLQSEQVISFVYKIIQQSFTAFIPKHAKSFYRAQSNDWALFSNLFSKISMFLCSILFVCVMERTGKMIIDDFCIFPSQLFLAARPYD